MVVNMPLRPFSTLSEFRVLITLKVERIGSVIESLIQLIMLFLTLDYAIIEWVFLKVLIRSRIGFVPLSERLS